MRFAVGLVCLAACAAKPAPPLANVQHAPPDRDPARATVAHRSRGGSGPLTPDVVLATIRSRYLGGVERCYRAHLKRDASARGRVLVSFTVDAKGRAREGAARGITDRVDDCIEAQIARWQFPRPAAEARFALGLELTID
jgi:hypothetical protein